MALASRPGICGRVYSAHTFIAVAYQWLDRTQGRNITFPFFWANASAFVYSSLSGYKEYLADEG